MSKSQGSYEVYTRIHYCVESTARVLERSWSQSIMSFSDTGCCDLAVLRVGHGGTRGFIDGAAFWKVSPSPSPNPIAPYVCTEMAQSLAQLSNICQTSKGAHTTLVVCFLIFVCSPPALLLTFLTQESKEIMHDAVLGVLWVRTMHSYIIGGLTNFIISVTYPPQPVASVNHYHFGRSLLH